MKNLFLLIIITLIVCSIIPFNICAISNVGFVDFSPQYILLEEYIGNHTLVFDSQYKIIDKYNNVQIESQYVLTQHTDTVYSFFEDGDSVLCEINGKEIARFQNCMIVDVNEAFIVTVDENGKYHLYSKQNNAILLEYCENILLISGKSVLWLENGIWNLSNFFDNRNMVLDIDDVSSTSNNVIVVIQDGLYGLFDKNGEAITEVKYQDIVFSNEQYLAFYEDGNDIFLSNGSLLYESPFEQTSVCINGWVLIYNDGFHLKNIFSEQLIELLSIQSVSIPHEGYMCVKTEYGLCTYLDMDGMFATDLMWDMVYPFSNGFALVYDVIENSEKVNQKQWYIINNSFEVVKTLDYDVYVDPYYSASTDFSDGYIRTIDNETGLMGFIYLENYSASSNNQLKLSPTSLYQIDRESQTLSEVFKDTTVNDFKNHFLNDTEMLSVVDADGNTLNADAYVVDGCKVQLRSKTNETVIFEELVIEVSELENPLPDDGGDNNDPDDSCVTNGHTPNADDGDCTTAITCSVCGTVTTEAKPSHTPNADDGDCTTAITCSVCGTVTTEAKPSHTPNADDGNCITAITCKDCGTVTTAAKPKHIPNADDGDCTTAITCSVCGTVTTGAKPSHTPNADDGNCATPVTCKTCNTVVTIAKEHAFDDDCDVDCNNEGCVYKRETKHVPYADDDDCTTAVICQKCGAVTTAAKQNHIAESDDGNCSTPVYCKHCNEILVSAKSHKYSNSCDKTCNNDGCSWVRTVRHKYDDKCDGKCDTCGYEREVPIRPIIVVLYVMGAVVVGVVVISIIIRRRRW